MSLRTKIKILEEKPYKVTCLESDYSASFKTEDEALLAKIRHQKGYPTHKVAVTETIILENE